MTSEIDIERICYTVNGIDGKKFLKYLDKYIRVCLSLDDQIKKGKSLSSRLWEKYEYLFEHLEKEAAFILSQTTIALNHMINYRFRIGNPPEAEAGHINQRYGYYRKIKRQQMEVLSSLADEIEILGSLLKQTGKMRGLIQKHSSTFDKASNLMNIICERITHRPMAVMKLDGNDEKIRELDTTIQNINKYEDLYGKQIQKETDENYPGAACSMFTGIIDESYGQMIHRKKRIVSLLKELKAGCAMMRKIVKIGYSNRMQASFNTLIENHNHRLFEFQSLVYECRLNVKAF